MQHDRTGQEQKKSLPSSRALMNAVPRAVEVFDWRDDAISPANSAGGQRR